MTTHHYGRPGQRAQALVDRMKTGQVNTSGSLASWCEDVADLPDPLRVWVWDDLNRNLEPSTVEYLQSLVGNRPDPGRITFRQVRR